MDEKSVTAVTDAAELDSAEENSAIAEAGQADVRIGDSTEVEVGANEGGDKLEVATSDEADAIDSESGEAADDSVGDDPGGASTDKVSGTVAKKTVGDYITSKGVDNFIFIPELVKTVALDVLQRDMQTLINNLECNVTLDSIEDLLDEFLKPPVNHMALLIIWTGIYRASGGKTNTIDTTVKNYNSNVFKVLDPYQVAEDITAEDMNALMGYVWVTPTAKGTLISESHANGIYRSVVRVMKTAVANGYIAKNVALDLDEALKPHPSKDTYTVEMLTKEQLETAFQYMLNMKPTYTNVKCFIVLYEILKLHDVRQENKTSNGFRTASFLDLTWPEFAAWDRNGWLDDFILGLAAKYKVAQKEYLEKCGITNPKKLVFVKKTASGTEGEVANRSTFYTWFRENVLKPNDLPLVSIDSLHSMEDEVYEVVDNFDVTATDYPIQGDVIIPDPNAVFGGHTGPKLTKQQKVANLKKREEYLAKFAGVGSPGPSKVSIVKPYGKAAQVSSKVKKTKPIVQVKKSSILD